MRLPNSHITKGKPKRFPFIHKSMKIVITGGNGFIGSYLQEAFIDEGHEVVVISRNPQKGQVYWDAKSIGSWIESLEGVDVLINLAGKSVNCRYTEANKKAILESRVLSTRVLGKAYSMLSEPPKIWFNASSATVYPDSLDRANTERSATGSDFSETVVKRWEEEFFKAETGTCRKIALRMAIVFDKKEGAFPYYVNLARSLMGGTQGTGRQKVSFIHIQELFRIIKFLIHDRSLSGIFNVSSPQPVSNQTLMQSIRNRIGMPFGLPLPKTLLKIGAGIIQTEVELLLKSRFVLPERLLFEGYRFKYENLNEMLPVLIPK